MMRRFLAFAALALFALPVQAARPLPKAELYAVYFYADWCVNCKALSPTLGEVRSDTSLQKAPLLFVTLDLSDKPRIHQSLLLANALGIGSFVQQQGSATGYVAVVDAATKKEVARFDRNDDAASILKTINEKLGD